MQWGKLAVLGVLTFFLSEGGAPSRGGDKGMPGAEICPAADVKWGDGPPALPPGAKAVVLEGDPSKVGPFVLRVKVQDGYKIMPHTHPTPERVTVLSGTFYLGMGEKFDADKGTALQAGSYFVLPTGMKHYAWVKGETVIQLHGMGPWGIEYVNAADDPRKAKK